jgi:hypothetical protein
LRLKTKKNLEMIGILNPILLYLLSFGYFQDDSSVVKLSSSSLTTGLTASVTEAQRNSEVINSFLKENHGNMVQLPPYDFLIAAPIIIPSKTGLSGSELGTSIWIHKDSKPNIAYFLNESFNLGTTNSDEKITLENLTIHGELHAPFAENTMGIFFNKVNKSIVRNLNLYGIKNEAIRFHSSMANVTAQNNMVEKCLIDKRSFNSKGIMFSSYTSDLLNENKSPAVVSNFTIRYCKIIGADHAIILFNVKDGQLLENECIASFQRGIILSPTVSNVTISRNIIDSAGSTGIHLAYNATKITIEKNKVTNTLKDMSGKGFEGQGIKAYAGFNNVRILENVCIANATDGIALEGGGAGKDFTISGNFLAKNKRNGIRLWAGDVSIGKGGDILSGTIQKNEIKGNLDDAIFLGSENKGQNKVKQVTVLADNIITPVKGKSNIKEDYPDSSNKIQKLSTH